MTSSGHHRHGVAGDRSAASLARTAIIVAARAKDLALSSIFP
jgi:hypothetical protein